MKRFYPDFIPEFAGEPTKDKFKVCTINKVVNQGVVSKASFKEGDVVFRFTGIILNEITQYTLQYEKGVHIHDPYFMGKVLHNCEPNTFCDMKTRTFYATKDIFPGDLITMNYNQTEEVLFKPFDCSCGSSKCVGTISGSNFEMEIPQYI